MNLSILYFTTNREEKPIEIKTNKLKTCFFIAFYVLSLSSIIEHETTLALALFGFLQRGVVAAPPDDAGVVIDRIR